MSMDFHVYVGAYYEIGGPYAQETARKFCDERNEDFWMPETQGNVVVLLPNRKITSRQVTFSRSDTMPIVDLQQRASSDIALLREFMQEVKGIAIPGGLYQWGIVPYFL